MADLFNEDGYFLGCPERDGCQELTILRSRITELEGENEKLREQAEADRKMRSNACGALAIAQEANAVLLAKNGELHEKLVETEAQLKMANGERRELRAENKQLKEMLGELEWIEGKCHICGEKESHPPKTIQSISDFYYDGDGHLPDCTLGKMLEGE